MKGMLVKGREVLGLQGNRLGEKEGVNNVLIRERNPKVDLPLRGSLSCKKN